MRGAFTFLLQETGGEIRAKPSEDYADESFFSLFRQMENSHGLASAAKGNSNPTLPTLRVVEERNTSFLPLASNYSKGDELKLHIVFRI
jgi:hypothetical protein